MPYGGRRGSGSYVTISQAAGLLLAAIIGGIVVAAIASRDSLDRPVRVLAPAAQPSPSPTPTSAPPPVAPGALDAVNERIDALRERQDDLDSRMDWFTLPLTFIAAVVGLGGIAGIVLSVRGEVRAGQSHDLVIRGEAAQQSRTEELHGTLLDASQKTLNLVNETLELAKDASERAAITMSQRAKSVLTEISEDATDLLAEAQQADAFPDKLLKVPDEMPRRPLESPRRIRPPR